MTFHNTSILIIGITKDSGQRLYKNVNKLLKLRSVFKTVDFLVYENNSNQLTKNVLKKIKDKTNGFNYISEDLTQNQIDSICKTKTHDNKPCRIELITYARNTVQKKAKELCQNQNSFIYDYIINIDFDVIIFNPMNIPKTLNRFSNTDFDVITGYGMTKRLRYRDAYAFRNCHYPFGPEFMPEYWWNKIVFDIQKRYKKNLKLKVFSAFGGAAIYTPQAYFSASYDCHPSKDFLDTHSLLLKESTPSDDQLKSALTVPTNDSRYTKPIICEHVPFHYSLIKQGYDKIFIDTSWRFIFKD